MNSSRSSMRLSTLTMQNASRLPRSRAMLKRVSASPSHSNSMPISTVIAAICFSSVSRSLTSLSISHERRRRGGGHIMCFMVWLELACDMNHSSCCGSGPSWGCHPLGGRLLSDSRPEFRDVVLFSAHKPHQVRGPKVQRLTLFPLVFVLVVGPHQFGRQMVQHRLGDVWRHNTKDA